MDTPAIPPLPLVATLTLQAALTSAWALRVPAWCAKDLGPHADDVIRDRLKARAWVPIARRIYRARSAGLRLWLGQPILEQAHLAHFAAALARQHGWRLAPGCEMARYAMLTGDRPLGVVTFGYDGNQRRTYRGGLVLEPIAPTVAALPLPAQMIVRGVGQEIATLPASEIDCLAGYLAQTSIWRILRAHAWELPSAAHYPTGVATLLDAIEFHQDALIGPCRAARQAPPGWAPPEPTDDLCRVEGWWLEEWHDVHGSYEVLRGQVFNHPYIDPGSTGFVSSPVVWIDLELGFARAESRVYRLGRSRFLSNSPDLYEQ